MALHPIPLPCALAFQPPSHQDATTPSPCWAPHFMTQQRIMFSNPTTSEPRLSPASIMSNATPSNLPPKWLIPKKDGATCVSRREPKKRSLEPWFRPSALVKRQQAAMSSMHALEKRTRPKLSRAFGTALLLGACKFARAMERRMQSQSPLSKRTSVALGTLFIW